MTTVYEMGPFRLDPQACLMTRMGIPEGLGPRAVGVLTVLLQHAHEVVTKSEIMISAWPGVVVEESNLTVQISAIRHVLSQVAGGDRWVETIARRGYRFIGPVSTLRDGMPQEAARESLTNLPESLTTFIGRGRELVELKRLLARRRALTLLGAGGIGKTRLALQLAAEVKDAYGDGIWLVDLAPLVDPDLVPNAAAQVLGVQQSPGKPLVEAIANHARSRRLLLILDNCEHLLDASARLAEAILRAGPAPTIVATSREPLRIGGEQIYRLATLSLPEPTPMTESIQRSEAVQLFVDRAQYQVHDFELTPARAPAVARLCVLLDGIPLALELAAAHVPFLSIDEINSRLNDRFSLLTEGSRTALPRQKTLRATLDWSYALLTESERQVFRRVSVFAGGFTLDAAKAVAPDENPPEASLAAALSRLVGCCLVSAYGGQVPRFRLLDTMRSYGLAMAEEAGETRAMRRRHAHYLRDRFDRATLGWLRLAEPEWRAEYVPEVDNLRAALDWSLGIEGDPTIAVGLAAASAPMWTVLSLYGEGVQRLEAAAMRVEANTSEFDEAALRLWQAILWRSAMPARALTSCKRAVSLFRKLGRPLELGHSSVRLAHLLASAGRFEESAAALAEALPKIEHLGLPKLLAFYFGDSGFLAALRGDPVSARTNYQMALSLFREAGNESSVIESLSNLADISWALGDLEAAEALLREYIAMRGSRFLRRSRIGFALCNLAGVLTERGDLVAALEAAREGLPLLEDGGEAWSFMDHLALRAALAGKHASAARLAGRADASHATRECPREPNEARARSRLHAALHEQFDLNTLEALLAEGRAMSEQEASRMALEE
jgi:predicted ATPase/DNA-binding winged helix-turn-helix (wHTH) protein